MAPKKHPSTIAAGGQGGQVLQPSADMQGTSLNKAGGGGGGKGKNKNKQPKPSASSSQLRTEAKEPSSQTADPSNNTKTDTASAAASEIASAIQAQVQDAKATVASAASSLKARAKNEAHNAATVVVDNTARIKTTIKQGRRSFVHIPGLTAEYYDAVTPQRTRLLDVFMVFLVVLGIVQFAYCVLAGSYPFNAFLSGFCATVGQFVLTASLRVQTQEGNKKDFPNISPERAFADYVVCSLILHFFCVNFIN